MYPTTHVEKTGDELISAWARDLLDNPHVVVLDVEPSSIVDPYIRELSVTTASGRELLSFKLNPRVSIVDHSRGTHQFTDDASANDAVVFDTVALTELSHRLQGRLVVCYDSAFTQRVIRNDLHRFYATHYPDHVGNLDHPYVDVWFKEVTATWVDVLPVHAKYLGKKEKQMIDYRWYRSCGDDERALKHCRDIIETLRTIAGEWKTEN